MDDIDRAKKERQGKKGSVEKTSDGVVSKDHSGILFDLDSNSWRWAPIVLLSPLPWAYVALFIILFGQPVLRGAKTDCYDPSGKSVKTDSMTIGLVFAVVIAYLFLVVFTWIFLGRNIYVTLPWRKNKKWSLQRIRTFRPFTSLKLVAGIWILLLLLAILTTLILIVGVQETAAVCARQTPTLISFSTFAFILGLVCILLTIISLVKLYRSSRVKKDSAGESTDEPKSDVDMVKVVFKQFDKSGDGHIDQGELGPFLEALGMTVDEDEIPEMLAEIDKDGEGTITEREFLVWYINDKEKRKSLQEGGL